MSFNLIILLLHILISLAASEEIGFTYHGFRSANLSLDGTAKITSNGLLKLNNDTEQETSYAFHPSPVNFKNSQNGSAFSFSTSFVFAIVSEYPISGSHEMAFVIASTRGRFDESNIGNSTNDFVRVELRTVVMNRELDDDYVVVHINGLRSESARPGYYDQIRKVRSFSLMSGQPVRFGIEYNGVKKEISVTLSPLQVDKPSSSPFSFAYDISPTVRQNMYVGLSLYLNSLAASFFVLGWSFKINGEAEELDVSQLPKLPRVGAKETSKFLTFGVPVILIASMFLAISGIIYLVRRKRKYAEVLEDWELEYGPHRFKYKDLHVATKGFRNQELLGRGGFGRVYRGVLPPSEIEIAVKRVSHESRQGMREFVAEIVSIGRLRHRNLVPLLGYCRRKGELFLVYECMPNGSLDKFLYNQPRFMLNWSQRFHVIKGVASALLYLHEKWEQVVVHRDIKASNVLLDGEFNARLGDFGLARLYDHGSGPQTTRAAGTFGYLAPEHIRTGKATTSSDVYSFGVFLLEVACGRRPIEPQETSENLILVDTVYSWWSRGDILKAVDPKLGIDYVPLEVELILKLGLLCSRSESMARPSMRQIVIYLEDALTLPDLSLLGNSVNGISTFTNTEGYDDFAMPCSSLIAESILSEGR